MDPVALLQCPEKEEGKKHAGDDDRTKDVGSRSGGRSQGSAGPSGNARGLACRWCGCKHFRVVYTRPAMGGKIIRRRECRHCGKRMTTWEGSGG